MTLVCFNYQVEKEMQYIMNQTGTNQQARAWLLTVNNPLEKGMDHETIRKLLGEFPTLKYWCMCDEIGDKGTYHTHIYYRTSTPHRFSVVKKKFVGAHIEKARGNARQNRDYVRKEGKYKGTDKEETNLPDTFEEFGKCPEEQQGKRSDLEILVELVKDGLSNAEIISERPSLLRYIDRMEQYRQMLREEQTKNLWRDVNCIYVYGETNTNKTRTYMERYGYENVYRVTNYNNNSIWDGYKGEDVVIFDEFRSQVPISDILTWTEGYPNASLRARYKDKVALYTKVIFISNIPLESQYQNIQDDSKETWRAFLRRIKRIYHHINKERIIEYKSTEDYFDRDEGYAGFVEVSDEEEIPFE